MLVYYSGFGYWNDLDGRLTELIRQTGVFELQYHNMQDIKFKKQTHTSVLDACFSHKDGAYPIGWVDEGGRYFFEIFKIDGKGGEILDEVVFTQQDIIEIPTKKKSKQEQREAILKQLINDVGLDELRSLHQIDIWKKLQRPPHRFDSESTEDLFNAFSIQQFPEMTKWWEYMVARYSWLVID